MWLYPKICILISAAINLLFLSVVGKKRKRAPISWQNKIIGTSVKVKFDDGEEYVGQIFQFLKIKQLHCIQYEDGEYGFVKINKETNLNITLNPTEQGEEISETYCPRCFKRIKCDSGQKTYKMVCQNNCIPTKENMSQKGYSNTAISKASGAQGADYENTPLTYYTDEGPTDPWFTEMKKCDNVPHSEYSHCFMRYYYIRFVIGMLNLDDRCRKWAIKKLTAPRGKISNSAMLWSCFEKSKKPIAITNGTSHENYKHRENVYRPFDAISRLLFHACKVLETCKYILAAVILTRYIFVCGDNCKMFLKTLILKGATVLYDVELLYKLAPDKVPKAYSPLGKDATGYKEMCVIIIDSVQAFMRRDENEIKFVPAFFQQITGKPVKCYKQHFTIMQLYMDLQYVLPKKERTTLRSNFTMFTTRGGGCASPNVLALKDLAAKVAKNTVIKDAHRMVRIKLGKSGFFFEVEHADCAVRKLLDDEFVTIEDSMASRTTRITTDMIESRYPVDLVKRGEYMEALAMCPNPN